MPCLQAADPGASTSATTNGTQASSSASDTEPAAISGRGNAEAPTTGASSGQEPDQAARQSLEAARKAERARRDAKTGGGAGQGQQAPIPSQNGPQQQVSVF